MRLQAIALAPERSEARFHLAALEEEVGVMGLARKTDESGGQGERGVGDLGARGAA